MAQDDKKVDTKQAIQNLRHWDMIRWITPLWYITLSTIAFAILLSAPLVQEGWFWRAFAITLALIGAASIHAVWKTAFYHRWQMRVLRKNGGNQNFGPLAKLDFESWSLERMTGTGMFQIVQTLLVIGWIAAAIYGPIGAPGV